MSTKLTVFLNLQTSDANYFDDENKREEIIDAINWALFEKNCRIFMLRSTKKEILKILEYEDFIHSVVADLFEKVENLEVSEHKASYFYWSPQPDQNAGLEKGDLLIEAVEQNLSNSSSKVVLFETYTLKSQRFIIKDEQNAAYRTSQDLPILIKIDVVGNENDLRDWLKKNRQPRKFHYNTTNNKHENDKNTNKKNKKGESESPLLYNPSEYQWVEENLLINAIGDFTNRENPFLAIWDKDKNAYLIFSDENTSNNSYHGHHLSNEVEINRKFAKKTDLKDFIDKKFKP